MKFLFILISLISAEHSCTQSKKNQDSFSVEYTAHSRGTYNRIIINKKQISIENKRGEPPIIKSCSEASWNTLLNALNPIDIENISNLKAPSENRFFDGAAIANLKITYNGKTYESQSFDHGNPPNDIAELVKVILSISENIE